MLMLSLLEFLQNRRLGIIPAYSLLFDFQRDSSVWSLLCGECSWWDVRIEDRMLCSTLWLIWPSNKLSKADLVFHYFLSTSISIQSGSNSLTILPQFLDLMVSFGDRPSKGWKPCEVSHLSCALIRNRVQHTFERDLPCRSSKLWCLQDFAVVLPVEYIQGTLDQWMTLGRPNRLSFAMLPTSSASFWVRPAICMSATYTDKNNCSLRWGYRHSFSGTFSDPSSIIPFSIFPLGSIQWVTVKIALKRHIWIVHWVPMLWSSCFRYSEPNCWTIFFSERRRSSGASFILTCVYTLTASLVCPEHPGNHEMMSKNSCRRHVTLKAPSSANTA